MKYNRHFALIILFVLCLYPLQASEYERTKPMSRPRRQNRFQGNESRTLRQQPHHNAESVMIDISAEELNMTSQHYKGKTGEINYCQAVENKAGTANTSLVLVLHGKSGCGNDNKRQLTTPAIKPLLNYIRNHSENAVVIVPQCPENQDWIRGGLNSPLTIIVELIKQKCSEFNISPHQVYITGVSMGGGACYSMMLRQPGLFSRAIIVSSGGKVEDASRLKGDFYIVHGDNDRLIPPAKAQAMANSIQKNPQNNVQFFILPGKDHVLASKAAYSDECFHWLFHK